MRKSENEKTNLFDAWLCLCECVCVCCARPVFSLVLFLCYLRSSIRRDFTFSLSHLRFSLGLYLFVLLRAFLWMCLPFWWHVILFHATFFRHYKSGLRVRSPLPYYIVTVACWAEYWFNVLWFLGWVCESVTERKEDLMLYALAFHLFVYSFLVCMPHTIVPISVVTISLSLCILSTDMKVWAFSKRKHRTKT